MDLYYRIAVTSIRLPPLRDRPGDVALLMRHFLAQFAKHHERAMPAIDDAVLERLTAYSWPGNVRELRNVVESMLLVCEGDRLTLATLPPDLEDSLPPTSDMPAAGGQRISELEADLIRRTIAATGGNLTRAASRLAIAKSTLYKKITDYNLHEEVLAQRSQRLSD